MRHLAILLAVGALVAAAAVGCGTTTTACGPTTCDGCCDSTGVCRTGDTDLACGVAGVRCNTCSNIQSCRARQCLLLEVDGGNEDAGTDAGTEDAGTPICGRTAVACSDQAILQLDLKKAPAPGLITNVAADGGFRSIVDAVGGGSPPTDSYVYAKFTSTGLQKVAIGDETALDTFDWDIAFRRFVIRLNGGDSGPACTAAAPLPPGTLFDTITTTPAIVSYPVDDFLTASPTCGFVADNSGLPSSPATALAEYYAYTNCVSMTGRVYIVQTRLGRHLKLEITGYYQTEPAQTACNGGTAPGVPGGTIRLRWAFLD